MTKHLRLSLIACAALFAAASPAESALTICFSENCADWDENLQFNDGDQTGNTIVGTTNKGTGITLVGSNVLFGDGGQSDVTGASGELIGTVTFFLTNGGTFTDFEFNLPGIPGNPPPDEADTLTFTILDGNGVAYTSAAPYPTYSPLNDGGQNRFGGFTTGGTVIRSVSFTLSPTGAAVDALKQLRIGGVAPIPEPASWAFMLMGFGAVGYAMRRRSYGRPIQAV